MQSLKKLLFALGAVILIVPASSSHAQQTPPDWPMYRGGIYRGGNQSAAGATTGEMAGLATPARAKTLHLAWTFPTAAPPGPALKAFIASPVVSNGVAYIGNMNGEFYAIDMSTGQLKWMFPNPANSADPAPLNGTCPWGNWGIQASATITRVKNEAAVIFGAPDPDKQTNNGFGSGRLWALDANDGHIIWKSDVVARVTGCTLGAFPDVGPPGTPPAEYHENLKYSSPLPVFSTPSPPNEPGGGGVYIGIASNEDPIQLGAVKEVDIWTGKAGGGYFTAAHGQAAVGGDVWNAPASDGNEIYFTTGNVRQWSGDCPAGGGKCGVVPSNIPCRTINGTLAPGGGPGTTCAVPNPMYGNSMVKIDPDGFVRWAFQPLPVNLDQDPDWNAGATVMNTDCGELLVSVMKDGWSYALNSADGKCLWQFPDMGNPSCQFPTTDTHAHGGNGFHIPGGTWGNVLVIATGGYALPRTGATGPDVSGRLHALDACEASTTRGSKPNVRWLLSPVPNTKTGVDDPVSAPSIINGLIYVSTDLGHLMVYADPSVTPAAGVTCDDTTLDIGSCMIAGGHLVPVPAQLIDISLLDAGDAARFRKEVVLAEGKALVSTSAGHVYAYVTN